MTQLTFTKATKKRAKARIALDGPSGSGKTFSALIAATVLADGGRIAVIDTEHGSASLYSDRFDFDVLELNTFSPQNYINAIKAAERAGYSVIVIDSLSHAWEGEGGALEMVDSAAAKSQSKNTYFAWRDVTPLHRKFVDAMLQSPCHIVGTMRSKTEYIIETTNQGKQVPRKIGMAPIQRAGMEYEFTVVGDLDLDHRIVISKSRCDLLTDKVEVRPGEGFWRVFYDWLNSGEAPAEYPAPHQPASATPEQSSGPEWSSEALKAEEESAAPAPMNGNGANAVHSPAPANNDNKPKPGQKTATIKVEITAWNSFCFRFATSFPNYRNEEGKPDKFHIGAAVVACGFANVTNENLTEVSQALTARAQQKAAA